MRRRRLEGDVDYQRLRRFFEFFNAHYRTMPPGLLPEHHPMAILESLEKTSFSRARSGLRQAVNDIVEMSLAFDFERVREIDAELRAQGIVTLSEVRRESAKHFGRILKRGRIKTETEYYLVRNLLDDHACKSPQEQNLLGRLLLEFEAHPTRARRR